MDEIYIDFTNAYKYSSSDKWVMKGVNVLAKRKKDDKNRKCKLCGRVFVGKSKLIDHIGNVHKDTIPEGWTASRYENFLRTGKTEGHCICCGEPTGWNESTWKYHRLCKNPKCRESLAKNAKKNMIGKYGKEHLLNDPEMQRKMVYAKSTSKTYYFEDPDDPSIRYPAKSDSSYGMDFFEMADVFLNFDGRDIIAPSPHVYYYMYEGKQHFYIPDAYIVSINAELEFKDGGSNPNKHPKIQAVDKEKERLKDEVMASIADQVNYVKIVNKNYSGFFALLSQMKAKDVVYMPKWHKPTAPIQEAKEYEGEDPTELIPDAVLTKTQKLGKKLYSNPVSYEEIMKDLRYDIDKISTPQEFQRMEALIDNIRDHLSTISNGQSDLALQQRYEANKAIQIIDTDLKVRLKAKERRLRKSPVKESMDIVLEEAIPISDLLDPMKFQPIYVLLTFTGLWYTKVINWWTKDGWTHSSFSFDETMTDMWSFTDKGLTHENINTGVFAKVRNQCTYSAYAIMVPTESKEMLREMLTIMESQSERFRYNFKGMFSFVFKWSGDNGDNKKFCSQFVTELLQMIDPDIISMKPSTVKPSDFATKSKKLVHVSHGILFDYNPKKTLSNLYNKIKKGAFEN